jgi:hypothetical protein
MKKTTKLRGTVTGVSLLGLLLSSCGDPAAPTNAQTAAPAEAAAVSAPQPSCYRQIMGRDTILVRLLIRGAAVTGELAVLPAEKDQARGPFSGLLTGTQVVANWQRTGEGVTQVHEVTFTLAGDSLRWREGLRTEKDGKWVLATASQSYQYLLSKVACAP